MTKMSLVQASELYRCASDVAIKPLEANWPPFTQFVVQLKRLRARLGEASAEDFWLPVIRLLKAYQFNVSSTPLSFNDPALEGALMLADLRSRLRHCQRAYPDMEIDTQNVLQAMEQLTEMNSNPLYEQIQSVAIGNPGASLSVVTMSTRGMDSVETLLSSDPACRHIQLVSPAQLRGALWFDHLVVVGPAHWYPDHVLTAPRAHKLHVLRYNCIRDYWRPHPAFPNIRSPRHWRWQPKLVVQHDESSAQRTEVDLPSLDVKEIMNSRHFREQRERHEEADAWLVRLAGGEAVFVDADASVDVIDLESDEDSFVRRIPLSELAAGMYVLLRTEGGGDYIVSVADEILGMHAEAYRQIQRDWKSRLRTAVSERGVLEVAVGLLSLGGELANEQNVRRWMSYRSIKTQDKRDFDAIMKLVGLAGKAEQYWTVMEKIDSAHRKAGFKIGNLLRQEVATADLQEMERRGRMDFVLPGVSAGKLTVFRVDDIHRQRHLVPTSLLSRPFDEQRLTWRS